MHWRRKWQPTPVFLPGESQGRRSLVGCCLWGRTELDTTEATWQQQQQHKGIYRYLSIYICMLNCSVMSKSLQPHRLQPARLLCSWSFPSRSTGVGYRFLLQGIFLIQESNLHLLPFLHWQVNFYYNTIWEAHLSRFTWTCNKIDASGSRVSSSLEYIKAITKKYY